MKTKAILEIIKTGMSSVKMNFNSDEWRTSVPSTPGWYFIETKTPLTSPDSMGIAAHAAGEFLFGT